MYLERGKEKSQVRSYGYAKTVEHEKTQLTSIKNKKCIFISIRLTSIKCQQNASNVKKILKHEKFIHSINKQRKKSININIKGKVLIRSKDREEGRRRINSYLKEKADLFTSRYKQKINEEED